MTLPEMPAVLVLKDGTYFVYDGKFIGSYHRCLWILTFLSTVIFFLFFKNKLVYLALHCPFIFKKIEKQCSVRLDYLWIT